MASESVVLGAAARCKSCGAAIEWAETETGKAMPLDAEPHVDGNMVVIDGVAMKALLADSPELPRRKSHFATCPQAARWRRR